MKILLSLLFAFTLSPLLMAQGIAVRSLNGRGTNTYLKNPILSGVTTNLGDLLIGPVGNPQFTFGGTSGNLDFGNGDYISFDGSFSLFGSGFRTIGNGFYFAYPVTLDAASNHLSGNLTAIGSVTALRFIGSGSNLTHIATSSLGFQPATNTYAGITNALGFQPPTNTLAGITAALGFSPSTTNQILNVPAFRKFGLLYPDGAGSGAFAVIGDASVNAGTSSIIAPTATDGVMRNFASAASVGANFGPSSNATNYRTARHIDFQTLCKLPENANERVWIGMTDQSATNMTASDNPAGNYAAFLYTTNVTVGFTNNAWLCVTKDNATENVTVTTAAVDTAAHLFRVWFDDANARVIFYIDGVGVATNTANLPLADTNLRWLAQGQNTDTNAHNIRFAWIYITADR